MSQLFFSASSFVGGNLSKWDTSNVKTMYYMFNRCVEFNGDVSRWDVSKVTEFYSTFEYCKRFDGDLSAWNTSNARTMYRMFKDAWVFSSNISNWNVAKVTTASEMVRPILRATLWSMLNVLTSRCAVYDRTKVQCGSFELGRVELGGCIAHVSSSEQL
jgi:surface protein